MKEPSWDTLQDLVWAWEIRYQKAVAKNKYQLFANVAGIDPKHSNCMWEEEINDLVQRQTTFIKYVITSELMTRMNEEGFKWAEMILNKQMGVYAPGKGNDPKYLFCFSMDDHKNVQIACDDLKDIDLGDIYAVTEFDTIMVTQFGKRSWTEDMVKSIRKRIREDLAYDYRGVNLRRCDPCPQEKNKWLRFRFRTKDEHIRIDTIAKVRKCMEKFDANPLDWMDRLFKPK